MKTTVSGILLCLLASQCAWRKEVVVNGSFEDGRQSPTGWTATKGARWEDGGRGGKCAVLGPAPKPGAWVMWSQTIHDFRPQTVYKFSAWVKADKRTAAQVLISGLQPHKAGRNFFYTSAGTQWKRFTHRVVGDPGTLSTVQLVLLNEGSPRTVYFDDVSLTVREEVAAKPVPIRKVPEVDAFRSGGNLISNGDMEAGEGQAPAGWYRTDPGLMSRTPNDKYFFDPAKDIGQYSWEMTGHKSTRSISVTVPKGGGWGGWFTQVHDIKPQTDYTLSFWVRMSAPSRMRVNILGQDDELVNYFARASWHWSLYSRTFNSGSYSGDCNVGFVLDGVGRSLTKGWIDRVELHEGVSPIGANQARMYHYYYDFTYISPDVVSPVPFAFEWCFDRDKQPPEICYVVELPKAVANIATFAGRLRHSRRGVIWTNTDGGAKVSREPIRIDTRPYVRYTIRQSQLRSGDHKSFLNQCFVPVPKRGLARHGARSFYCATTSLWLYAATNLTKPTHGEIPPAYYYAKWKGGRQPKEKLSFRLTRIPAVPAAKRMVLIAGQAHGAARLNPRFVRDYVHLGLNGLDGLAADVRSRTSGKNVMAEAAAAGIRYFSTWTNIPAYGSGDPAAKAAGTDGRRNASGWCLEYRGPDWTKRIDGMKKKLAAGINTFLFDDSARSVCFCPRCKAVFKEFLKEHGRLEYVDPSVFTAAGWKGNPEYPVFWENFPLWHYGKTAAAMKKKLRAHARSNGISGHIYFGISHWRPYTRPYAAATISCFDFDSSQSYINGGGFSPKAMSDHFTARQKALGKYARPFVPTIGPGLTYWHRLLCLDPHAVMRDQILELMMVPKALGYTVYAGSDFDLGDMKYAAEANTILSRFEDVFVRGDVVDGIGVTGTSESSVRAKKLGGEMLVLVGDYSTYEATPTRIAFTLPGGGRLTDIATGQTITPQKGTYAVTVKDPRVRMFHSGRRH